MKLAKGWLRAFGLASIFAGPIFGIAAVVFALNTSRFLQHASHADGTITRLIARTDTDNAVNYFPTFTFTAPAGNVITVVSGTGSNPPAFIVGEHVDVLFDPSNPQSARLNSITQLWLFPILFGFFAIILTPIGVLLLLNSRIANAPIPTWTASIDVN